MKPTDEEIRPIMTEQQVNEFLRAAFCESWMDESDWNEMLSELQKFHELKPEEVAKNIQIGIENGYSLEVQIEAIKKLVRTA